MEELDKIVRELISGSYRIVYDRDARVILGRKIRAAMRDYKHTMSALKRENRKLHTALKPVLMVEGFKKRNFLSRWLVKLAFNIAKKVYEECQ